MRLSIVASVLLLSMPILSGCGNRQTFIEVEAPPEASNVKLLTDDKTRTQLTFSLHKLAYDVSIVGVLEPQLEGNGFKRCDRSDDWSDVRKVNEPLVQEYVRFYTKDNRRMLAVISITQRCGGDQGMLCDQNIVVGQTRFPKEIENAEELVGHICAGTPMSIKEGR